MDLIGTIVNAAAVAAMGIILGWLGNGRLAALERRMDRLEEGLGGGMERLEGRMDRLEERLEGRMDGLQLSVDSLRSDLTQVALAVGVRPRTRNA